MNNSWDHDCQLCNAEPTAMTIDGVRVGDRCYQKALAIKADADQHAAPRVPRKRNPKRRAP